MLQVVYIFTIHFGFWDNLMTVFLLSSFDFSSCNKSINVAGAVLFLL